MPACREAVTRGQRAQAFSASGGGAAGWRPRRRASHRGEPAAHPARRVRARRSRWRRGRLEASAAAASAVAPDIRPAAITVLHPPRQRVTPAGALVEGSPGVVGVVGVVGTVAVAPVEVASRRHRHRVSAHRHRNIDADRQVDPAQQSAAGRCRLSAPSPAVEPPVAGAVVAEPVDVGVAEDETALPPAVTGRAASTEPERPRGSRRPSPNRRRRGAGAGRRSGRSRTRRRRVTEHRDRVATRGHRHCRIHRRLDTREDAVARARTTGRGRAAARSGCRRGRAARRGVAENRHGVTARGHRNRSADRSLDARQDASAGRCPSELADEPEEPAGVAAVEPAEFASPRTEMALPPAVTGTSTATGA